MAHNGFVASELQAADGVSTAETLTRPQRTRLARICRLSASIPASWATALAWPLGMAPRCRLATSKVASRFDSRLRLPLCTGICLGMVHNAGCCCSGATGREGVVERASRRGLSLIVEKRSTG
eukprot:189483-Chlamydomonas_euryale.AAC.2